MSGRFACRESCCLAVSRRIVGAALCSWFGRQLRLNACHAPCLATSEKYNEDMTTIMQAERLWREAHNAHQRINTVRTLGSEQDAWDIYAELCDEAGKCLQPGCFTYTFEYAYCEEHQSQ